MLRRTLHSPVPTRLQRKNDQIWEADKANACLQAQLESLQDKSAELTAALEKAQEK